MQAFNGRAVITDVYLKCQTGDIIGLLGRNGSGKSTLLKMLFGSLKGDHKFIRIDGIIYRTPFKADGIIGYLPQHNFLPKHLSVQKVVSLYLDDHQVAGFLDDSLIGELKDSRINSLSGGELRYLEIKLILNTSYKFVLMDEPFNGVAPIMVDRLKTMITEHAQTKGIILTDHDYRNVLEVANRYCLMYDGGIKNIDDEQDLVRWKYLSGS